MRILLLLLFFLPILLYPRQKTKVTHPNVEIPYEPWFTGPLLAPTPVNMEPGHPAIQPSLTIFNDFAEYDSNWKLKSIKNIWSIVPLVDFQFAITKNTGIELLASFVHKFSGGKHFTHLEDTILLLGYQVSDDIKDSWVPDFRFLISTIFPTGHHENLDFENGGIDITGQGAYFFGPQFAFQKLFYLPNSFFVLRWSASYSYPTRAKVRGLNAYGGGEGTDGKIRPGQLYTAFFSGEYSLNKHWVLAFDTVFLYQTSTSKFTGDPGITPEGTPATVGLSSSTQISFAPEIQYNFSKRSGLIFGIWFTIAGRNAAAFASSFIAYEHVF